MAEQGVASRSELSPDPVSLLAGVVVEPDGRPIEGAQVLWMALQPEDVELTPAWPNASWGVPVRATTRTDSSATGVFAFDVAPQAELAHGSILVAYAPGHLPGGLDLARRREEWPLPARVVLDPAPSIDVLVVDAGGRPQTGATVHHAIGARGPAGPGRTQHERFFAQDAITGPGGHVAMIAFPGDQAFWAEKDDLASRPWEGLQPHKVALTLEAAFLLSGTLTMASWADWDPDYRGERRILVSGQRGNLWWPLARLRDVEPGEWGPLRVPLGGFGAFRARLEGAPIVPIERIFGPPEASESRRIEFAAERLEALWLYVRNEEERPITTAMAEARWEGFFGEERVEGASRSDGRIFLGSFPPGQVYCRVWAPGYGPVSLQTGVPNPNTIIIDLQRGGRLHGKCVFRGEPVEDFETIYSNSGAARTSYSRTFLGRKDGSFELEVGTGDWSVYAASPVHPNGKAVSVRLTAGADEEVVLELSTSIRGGGRVVDPEGEGVPNARVQPYSSGGMEPTFPWGPPAVTDADGSFELEAFVEGSNWITIEADGLAREQVKALARSTDFLDWGEIRLARPQALEMSLIGMEGLDGIHPGQIHAYTAEGYVLPSTPFDAAGTVRFDAVPPGLAKLVIEMPDGAFSRLDLELDPGESWAFEHKIAGDRRLAIRVLDAKGEPLSPSPSVYLSGQETSGLFVVRWAPTGDDGFTRFEGIRAEQVQALVLDSTNQTLATRDIALGPHGDRQVDIRIGDHPLRVRVVDGDGVAVTRAWVTLFSADGARVLAVDDTGADGWADLFVVDVGAALLEVRHGIAGMRHGIPIDASVPEHEVVLDARGRVELRLVDGEQPLAGVTALLETTGGTALSVPVETDAQGRARFEPLGEGRYHYAFRRADCWPTVIDVDLEADKHVQKDVQMRRLANVRIVVRNRDGVPVSAIEVELHSKEFGEAVASWLARGQIDSPTGLVTDGKGEIRIDGLPRGGYVWSVSGAEGPTSGIFELAPAETGQVVIQLAQ